MQFSGASYQQSTRIENRAGFDIWLLFVTTAIAMFGALFVLTSSAVHSWQLHLGSIGAIFWSHAIRFMLGTLLLIMMTFIDFRLLARAARPIMYVSLTLLVVVLFVKQPGGATAHRWITLFGFSFQPAEVAKFAMIAYLAARLSEHESRPESQMRQVYKGCLIHVAIMLALIIMEPNLSMAMLVMGTAAIILYLSGIRLKPLLLPGAIAFTAMGIVAWLTPYMRSRLTAYGAGIVDPMSSGYQVKQALIGIGQGGAFGVGIGESTQKHFFLPEPYKDFIFSIVGEEWGFAGACLLLTLYFILIHRAWKIARASRESHDQFGYFLAAGICATISISTVINVGVTLGLLPATGQPLPLFSYGGTSLMMTMASIGILLNISRQTVRGMNRNSTNLSRVRG